MDRRPENEVRFDVRLEHESLWLTRKQMSELFGRDQSVISRYVRKAFADDELSPRALCRKCIVPPPSSP